ncbi:MAG: sugar ABC transporter ATP-binding protein, partial [Opitutaceae bacterium]
MPTPVLELRGLTKSFGGARALRGVDFDLYAGEVHALLGENGAGKSTLIKIVTGAHQPDAGTIAVAGKPAAHLTPASAHKLGIACIYQQPALFPDLTVAENVALRLEPGAALRRVDWTARRERARKLLERIGASISPEAEVRELSMPEQQLVEIACALGAGARIVIMDEPTASLTQKEQHLLFAVVRDLRASGVGVIYISHRLEEIFSLANRVTVLRDGQSVGTSPVSAIDQAALIRMMVGREMTQIYPPAESAPGRVVLSLKNVGCAASHVQD